MTESPFPTTPSDDAFEDDEMAASDLAARLDELAMQKRNAERAAE